MTKADPVMTRGGDRGETSLTDGSRLPKCSQRVMAYGTVDELNSVVGLVRCEVLPAWMSDALLLIQQQLFDLAGELATPTDSPQIDRIPKVAQQQVVKLEQWLDEANRQLEPALNFILPGGSRPAATLHLARTVSRRCEREIVAMLEEGESVTPCCLKFINRLSDLFFVWARYCNDLGQADIRRHAVPE